ncbi:hypothetical protein PSP20601_05468 [Pandoraea sputorum]|nr:hypothetical protein PSP20601_05468 [Pandoraea sputorum]
MPPAPKIPPVLVNVVGMIFMWNGAGVDSAAKAEEILETVPPTWRSRRLVNRRVAGQRQLASANGSFGAKTPLDSIAELMKSHLSHSRWKVRTTSGKSEFGIANGESKGHQRPATASARPAPDPRRVGT